MFHFLICKSNTFAAQLKNITEPICSAEDDNVIALIFIT